MSDLPKDYSLYDAHDYGNSSPHKLASPPKPAPRTMPRTMTQKLKEREGKLPLRYSEEELSPQQLMPHSPFQSLFQSSKQQNQQLTTAQHYQQQQHQQQQLPLLQHQQQLQQQQQQNSSNLRPFNILTGLHQYKPCQSVKPSTSEQRKDHSHRSNDNYHPLSQPDPKVQDKLFLEKVVEKLQALKNDSASNSSKHTFDMPSCQAERGHAVLDNHFNNHFTINHKPSRSLKKSRNEPIRRTNPIKAFCTYVEFDGARKTEITSYLLKPRSNTLHDLKRELPSRSEGSKLFFRNLDNVLEQADYEEQQLQTHKDKDGSDMIICEIVVPKTSAPRLD